MTPFRSILVFYHVAQELSVAEAAKVLNVTPSAVSQQLRVLEERVGAGLITRSGRHIKLTEMGERYFGMISGDVAHIIEVTDQIQGVRKKSLLTIRATPTVATKWLLPRLDDFLERYPEIDVRINGSSEPADFAKDSVDLEIRHGNGHWPGLNAEHLVNEQFIPVCSPELIPPRSITALELLNFRLIYSVKAQVQWQTWLAQSGLDDSSVEHRLFFDRSHMSIDAAAQKIGVALESNFMMFNELQDHLLDIPVVDALPIPAVTQWLVCPPDSMRKKEVRRFMEWISQQAYDWSRTTQG